ncbi:MAG: YdeI/OmpD-associated family protein [Bacteroidota bacterium]
MYKPSSPEDYIAHAPAHYQAGLTALREVLAESELQESIKWNMPVYHFGKKNVATLFHAKNYLGVWFAQGALLADPNGLLVNASPEKTVAQRQLRFPNEAAVDLELVRGFLAEAIQNQKDGLELEIGPAPKFPVPEELQRAMDEDVLLAANFAQMPPYKQREFNESISTAKRAETRQRRLEKAITHIREGIGLTDKYRK